MKLSPIFLAALLASTAAVPVALGQTQQAPAQANQQHANADACQELSAISEEHSNRFQPEWNELTNTVIQAGQVEECAAYVERAEEALEANQTADSGSRIVVEQPEPRVTVRQDAPEVTVGQAEPQVSVNQGQPEIIVRQAQPTVTVDMPQPTITIDQPEPQIIVRMPEPDVNVATPEPEVEVSQSEPEVSVQQEEPQVNVEVDEPAVDVDRADRAEVNVEREQAVVRQSQSEGEAEVSLQREEPVVSYERAEPNVEVNSAGEPQVQFTESGEPTVQFEDQAAEAAQPRGSEQQAAARADRGAEVDSEQTGSVNARDEGERYTSLREQQAAEEQAAEEQAARSGRAEGAASADNLAVQVSAIIGRDVHNDRGEELGTVSRAVTDGERNYAVLANGGFLGLGEREVAIPMDRLSVERGRDELIMRGVTAEEIEDLPRFDPATGQELQGNHEVTMSSL
jgi:hypothetical protein